jgi:hypothetical protein
LRPAGRDIIALAGGRRRRPDVLTMDLRTRSALLGATLLLAACGGGAGGPPNPPDPNPPLTGAVPLGRAVTLATNQVLAAGPVAGFSASGTASVLWAQSGLPIPGGGTRAVPDVGARESTSGDTWTPGELINSGASGTDQSGDQIRSLAVTAGQPGVGASAGWHRVRVGAGAADAIVGANRESAGWSSGPVAVAPAGGSINGVVIGGNGQGTEAAAWVETPALGIPLVQVSVRAPGVGWGPKFAVQTNTLSAGSEPAVAVDPAGNVMVVWRQGGAGAGIVWSRRLLAGAGWGSAGAIDGLVKPDSGAPQVVAIGVDRFMATWLEADGGGTGRSLRAKPWSGAAWQGTVAATLEGDTAPVEDVRLTALPSGGALAVWRQGPTLRWNRFSGVIGQWLIAPLSVAGTTSADHAPQIAADGDGRVFATWLRTLAAGDADLMVTTLAPNGDAFSPAVSARLGAGSASNPAMAVSPGSPGSVALAWRQAIPGQSDPDLLIRLWRR